MCLLKKILKSVSSGLGKIGITLTTMPAPAALKTIAEILSDLNPNPIDAQWIEVPEVYSLTSPKKNGKQFDFTSPSKGIVVKVFFNTRTGELKTFLAKSLNIPDREDYWP